MKIVGLTPKLRREVASLRDECAGVVSGFTKRGEEFSRMDRRRQSLEREISDLERQADPDDREKIRRLAECQVELGLIVKKLHNLGDADEQPLDRLRPLLAQAQEILPRVLKPTADSFIAKIVKSVRPYCTDSQYALWLARQTPAATQLAGAIQWPHRYAEPNIGLARAIKGRCNEILSGKLEWKFIRITPTKRVDS